MRTTWVKGFLGIMGILIIGVIGFNLFKAKMIEDYLANQTIPEVPVQVEEAQKVDWRPTIEAIGFIEPFQGVAVTTSVAGLVEAIHFRSGDVVEKGQLLVELDTEVEKANLASAKARLPSVKRQMERNRVLLKKKTVSQTTYDDSEAAYLSLKAEIQALEATIARRIIRAPFSGVIGIRQINKGEYLQAGSKIGRLENLSQMRVRFIVPQKSYPKVKSGMAIEVKTDAYPDRPFKGTITAIEPVVDFKSGVFQVQASLPNTNNLLRSGMYASIRVWLPAELNRIVIPQKAINFSLYGESVYLVEDGVAQLTNIQVGERRGDQAVVIAGVAEHDEVVVAGQVRLSNGARIKKVTDDFFESSGELPKD